MDAEDFRNLVSFLALIVSLFVFFDSKWRERRARERDEVRSHFDADFRDRIHEDLKELRDLRRELIRVAYRDMSLGPRRRNRLRLTNPAFSGAAVKQQNNRQSSPEETLSIDAIRGQKIGPIVIDVNNTIDNALETYYRELDRAASSVIRRRTNPPYRDYKLEYEKAHDAFFEAISSLKLCVDMKDHGALEDRIADLHLAAQQFDGRAREIMNRIRAAIVTRKVLSKLIGQY